MRNVEKIVILTAISALAIPGCRSPIRSAAQEEFRRAVATAPLTELGSIEPVEITLTPEASSLKEHLTDEQMQLLDRWGGLDAYKDRELNLGANLTGSEFGTVQISLREAIEAAVQYNFGSQLASLAPTMAEAELVGAEARFDSVWFTNFDWSKLDQPTTTSVVNGIPLGTGLDLRDRRVLSTGIRKNLITGGAIEISTNVDRLKDEAPGASTSPDPAYTTSVELSITQPLLRAFGSEANMAQIRMSRNAHRDRIEEYRRTLLLAVSATEKAYWDLVLARHALQIRERLMERGIETRDKLVKRKSFDADRAQIADALARVESRRIAVHRARNMTLRASDQLKLLMNAPGLPVGGEVVVEPSDVLLRSPLSFNYADAIMTALRRRPEVRQALLEIDDATIRQMLADNLRLPKLDLSLRVRFNGLGDSWEDGYEVINDDSFVDYFVSLVMEVPIGNREPQANYRHARLRRMQSLLRYEQRVQDIVLQVKNALRTVKLNYDLLTMTRDARLAAAENLRSTEIRETHTANLTPEFLNLKFNHQEALARAELDELAALADYQVAASDLYFNLGIGLERNQIEFVVPQSK